MKALCLVAHPDDCVIFGWGFIKQYPYFDWNIAYLTYEYEHERSLEVRNFWKNLNISTIHGEFQDDWRNVEKNLLGFDSESAANFCQSVLKNYDLLLTHNYLGEYGHLHHKFIHETVKNSNIPKVYFGNYPEHYTHIYHSEKFNVKELPIHENILSVIDFSTYKYYITNEAEQIIRNEAVVRV